VEERIIAALLLGVVGVAGWVTLEVDNDCPWEITEDDGFMLVTTPLTIQ